MVIKNFLGGKPSDPHFSSLRSLLVQPPQYEFRSDGPGICSGSAAVCNALGLTALKNSGDVTIVGYKNSGTMRPIIRYIKSDFSAFAGNGLLGESTGILLAGYYRKPGNHI